MFSGCGTTGYVERVRLEAGRLWRRPLRPARRETMEAWTRGLRSGRKRPSLGGRGEETACWVVGEARDGTPTCHRALLYTGPGRRPGRGRTGRMGRAQVVRRPPRGPRGRLFCSSSSLASQPGSVLPPVACTRSPPTSRGSHGTGPRPCLASHLYPRARVSQVAEAGEAWASREAHVEAGQGPGWWPYSKPGCGGCRLVRPIPRWCGRVGESVAVGADQSRVSVHAECP